MNLIRILRILGSDRRDLLTQSKVEAEVEARIEWSIFIRSIVRGRCYRLRLRLTTKLRHIKRLIATLAFLLGVMPLLIYNVRNNWGTFHGNLTRDTQAIPAKLLFLYNTEAKGMFGWLTTPDWQTPTPHPPKHKPVLATP